jgi:hypothetical protein
LKSFNGWVAESLACRFQQVRTMDFKRLLDRFQIAYFFASWVCGYAAGTNQLVAINRLVDMVEATAGGRTRASTQPVCNIELHA